MNEELLRKINDLNKNKYFTNLEPLTYGMLINNIDYLKKQKIKSEYSFLDLQKLVLNFKLDIPNFVELENPKVDQCELGTIEQKEYTSTGFISKKYFSGEFTYSYPPIGPIPKCFKCSVCKNIGPQHHTINCSDPFDYSLYLTSVGSEILKEKKIKYPVEYAFLESYEPNTAYTELVRKRGQKKVHKKSVKTRKFENNVELRYQDSSLKQCIIRISKNGAINIISAQYNNNELMNLVLNKINETSALNIEEYQKIYPGERSLKIIPEITYKYLIQAQFQLISESFKEFTEINLQNIYDYLKNNDSDIISHLQFNSGDVTSKSGKQTNPILQFNLEFDNFNVSVSIYKKGAVQLRLSFLNKTSEDQLDITTLQKARTFITTFLKEVKNIYIPNFNYKNTELNLYNTIDGSKPKECRIQDRPTPYSFNGKCKDGYYSTPWGKKRRIDGLYEPCCYKITKNGESSLKNINELVLNGFPNNENSKKYEIDNPDIKSAVYIPGSKNIEQRRFKGLNDLSSNELLTISKCVSNKNSFGKMSISLKEINKMTKYLLSIH